jgi:hypothetical protein
MRRDRENQGVRREAAAVIIGKGYVTKWLARTAFLPCLVSLAPFALADDLEKPFEAVVHGYKCQSVTEEVLHAFTTPLLLRTRSSTVQETRSRQGINRERLWPFLWTQVAKRESGEEVKLVFSSATDSVFGDEISVCDAPTSSRELRFGVRPLPRQSSLLIVLGRRSMNNELCFFLPSSGPDPSVFDSDVFPAKSPTEFAVYAAYPANKPEVNRWLSPLAQVVSVIDERDKVSLYDFAMLAFSIAWTRSAPYDIAKEALLRARETGDREASALFLVIASAFGAESVNLEAREVVSKLERFSVSWAGSVFSASQACTPLAWSVHLQRRSPVRQRILLESAAASPSPVGRYFCLESLTDAYEPSLDEAACMALKVALVGGDGPAVRLLLSVLETWRPTDIPRGLDEDQIAWAWVRLLSASFDQPAAYSTTHQGAANR